MVDQNSKFKIQNFKLKLKTFKFLIALLTFNFLLLTFPVYAVDSIGKSRISPASPLYFLKSVREILELKFADSLDIKARLQLEFANRRIREARSLVKTSHEDLIEPTLTRYAAHLQEFANIANFSDKDLKAKIADVTTGHMKVLQEIYGVVSEQKAKRSVRVAIYKLSEWDNILMNKTDPVGDSGFAGQVILSKRSGCDFLSKEASNSAIVETERWVLFQRAQKCSLKVVF